MIIGLLLGPSLAHADDGAAAHAASLAISDFAYVDTSGEPADQAAVHQRRLAAFMAALRRDVAADRRYRLVSVSCEASCVGDGAASADLLRAAAEAGAKILVIGGIHKMSTLIQWAKVEAIDIDADRVILDRLFTFRGDSDEAWERAEAFVSQDIRAALATP